MIIFLSMIIIYTCNGKIYECSCHICHTFRCDDVEFNLYFQACLYLYDVPSVEHPGHILGSVVFGESFLDSAVRTLVPGIHGCAICILCQ